MALWCGIKKVKRIYMYMNCIHSLIFYCLSGGKWGTTCWTKFQFFKNLKKCVWGYQIYLSFGGKNPKMIIELKKTSKPLKPPSLPNWTCSICFDTVNKWLAVKWKSLQSKFLPKLSPDAYRKFCDLIIVGSGWGKWKYFLWVNRIIYIMQLLSCMHFCSIVHGYKC